LTSSERGKPSISDTGGSDGDDALATAFSEFARTVHDQEDPQRTLEEVVRAAVVLIPGCDEASISVIIDRRHVTSDTATGDLPRQLDELQERLNQGPCLDAAYVEETVRVADMATETRWPEFTAAALEAGAAGMMCLQLYVEGDNLGALNLFARTPWAFTDESEHIGLMFAAHAAVAYASSRSSAAMGRQIVTRQLIGQAQGILMERHRLTADNAFSLLVRVSQHRNVKLRDVAERLVRSGQLDALVPVPPE
jgi:transcriptional regulator with GAF, ATPase, and Fis domain